MVRSWRCNLWSEHVPTSAFTAQHQAALKAGMQKTVTDATSHASTLAIVRVLYVCLCLIVCVFFHFAGSGKACSWWLVMLGFMVISCSFHFLYLHKPCSLSLSQHSASCSTFLADFAGGNGDVCLFPLLINKRGLSSNTMLIHPRLICPPILFIISLLSHCSWPLLRHWNGLQDYQCHINFCDSLYCPHLTSILWSPCPPHHILFPHLWNSS